MTTEESTKSVLLDAAKKLFAKQGFDGTTVKDIAEAAGVNVSLVSYHFDGKAGLYSAVIGRFASDRFSAAQRILTPASNFEEFRVRLEMYIGEIIGAHVDQPDSTCIMQREIDHGMSPMAEEMFRNTFLRLIEFMFEFFRDAQKKKIIRKDVTPMNATMILMGSVLHVAQKDAIAEKFFGVTIKDETHRTQIIKDIVNVFLNGMKVAS